MLAGDKFRVPTVPRIGGSVASYVPLPPSAAPMFGPPQVLNRFQVAPALGVAGSASAASPWLGLAQSLNAYMSGGAPSARIGGGVGSGSMFGAQFGHTQSSSGVPSRRTIYGPGPRAF